MPLYNVSGAELVYYKNRNEYRIWNHCPARINENSPISTNCRYIEDRWKVSINPIRVKYKNENYKGLPKPTVANIISNYDLSKAHGVDNEKWKHLRELDLKDKFIKVRIRYSGEELAIIHFLQTFYNISHG